jgi:hypothetical protein
MLIAILLIKVIGVFFATFVFAKFTPLVDSQLYLKGFYVDAGELRTLVIQWLALAFNRLGGDYFAHYAFAVISTLGLVYYCYTGGRRWAIVCTLLLPSALVWTSIVGKEAVYCGASGLALVIWSKYAVRPLSWHDVLIAVMSLGVCFLLRPHYAVALLWLFVAIIVLKQFKGKAWIFLMFLLFVGALAIYFLVWQQMLERGYGGIEATARASRFQSLGIAPGTDEGLLQFKSFLPLGLIVGVVGPLPSEVIKRVEFFPFFLEGGLVLIAPLLILLFAIKRQKIRSALFLQVFSLAIMPAVLILMVMHAPFGLLNPGSAIRWRTNFEQLFYLAPLLLMYSFSDEKS